MCFFFCQHKSTMQIYFAFVFLFLCVNNFIIFYQNIERKEIKINCCYRDNTFSLFNLFFFCWFSYFFFKKYKKTETRDKAVLILVLFFFDYFSYKVHLNYNLFEYLFSTWDKICNSNDIANQSPLARKNFKFTFIVITFDFIFYYFW